MAALQMRNLGITESTSSRGRVKDSTCATSPAVRERVVTEWRTREERLRGLRLRLVQWAEAETGGQAGGSAGASAR